jgi:RecB family exonuclease
MTTENHVLSYSEIDTFRQCPLKHQWSYVERWRRPVDENGALAKGSLWHLVMETHYQVLQNHDRNTPESCEAALDESRQAVSTLLVDTKNGQQSDTQALVQWMFEGYVAHWGADPDWDIVGIEQAFRINLPDPQGQPSPYDIKGKMDLVVRDRKTGHLWVVDHKSGANLPSQMDLEIDDQFGLYSWAMKQEGTPVLGAIHNAARTTRNLADFPDYSGKSQPQTLDQRHLRTFLNRSEAELTSIALDAWAVAANAYPTGEARPLYSAPDPRQCGWKCDFKEVHLLARKGRSPQVALEEMGFAQDFTRH